MAVQQIIRLTTPGHARRGTPPLFALAALIALLGARPGRAAEEKESEPETHARVKVALAREGTLPISIRALGRIVPLRQTPSQIPAVAGGIVTEIAVREGAKVAKGDVLLRLDPRAAAATLKRERSALALAEAEARHAEEKGMGQERADLDIAAKAARTRALQAGQDRDRLAALLEKSLVSEKAATEARQAAEAAEREAAAAESKAAAFDTSGRGLEVARLHDKIEEARTALQLAEIEAEGAVVKAPADGRVARLWVAAGQVAEKGAALVDLQFEAGVGVVFELAPAQARRLHPPSALMLADGQSTHTFAGSLISIAGAVDPETGLVRVEGMLERGDDPPLLGEILPGELVLNQSPPGIIVPLSALSVDDGEAFVHTVDEAGHAHRVEVEVLARSSREAVIGSPAIKAGTQIVTDGNFNLPDGAGVAVEEAP